MNKGFMPLPLGIARMTFHPDSIMAATVSGHAVSCSRLTLRNEEAQQVETQQPPLAALSAEFLRGFTLYLPSQRPLPLVAVRAL